MSKRVKSAKTYDIKDFLNIEKPVDHSGQLGNSNMSTPSPSKPKKKRINPFSVFLLLFIIYTIIILGSQQVRLYRFEKDITNVTETIMQAEIQKDKLRQQIELMNTDEYIEKIARDKLGLIKQGEIPYIAVPSEDEADVRIIDRDEAIIDVED